MANINGLATAPVAPASVVAVNATTCLPAGEVATEDAKDDGKEEALDEEADLTVPPNDVMDEAERVFDKFSMEAPAIMGTAPAPAASGTTTGDFTMILGVGRAVEAEAAVGTLAVVADWGRAESLWVGVRERFEGA